MDNHQDRAFTIAGPEVIAKDFGEELVVANLNSGIFYSLRGGAIPIWCAIERGHSQAEIIGAFTFKETSGEAIESSVSKFLDQLIAEALIVPRPPSAGESGNIEEVAKAFAPPVIERFDDLQGLLLIDPIHDTSELGWPMVGQKSTR
jgi:hypothetical protein